jgi:hypothetical protein
VLPEASAVADSAGKELDPFSSGVSDSPARVSDRDASDVALTTELSSAGLSGVSVVSCCGCLGCALSLHPEHPERHSNEIAVTVLNATDLRDGALI